jgi:hypothetical protein
MADSVQITEGSGKWIATDEVSDTAINPTQPVNYQYIKIGDGTLGGTGKAAVSATLGTTGLAVNARMHDGTNGAVIKNTAATGSDNAVVVQFSPIGEVADGSTDAGTGNKISAKAIAGLSSAANANLTALQRGDLLCDLDRALLMRPHCGLEDLQTGTSPVTITTTTSTAVLASAGTGLKWYLTSIAVSNTSTSTPITLNILDGATVRWTMPVPVGGAIQNFATPLGGFTAATAVNVQCSAAATSIIVSANGFKSKV